MLGNIHTPFVPSLPHASPAPAPASRRITLPASAASMAKGSMYTFQKWLMIGAALLVFATIFAQFPLSSSEPNITDYDLADEKEAQQYLDDVDGYEGQVASLVPWPRFFKRVR